MTRTSRPVATFVASPEPARANLLAGLPPLAILPSDRPHGRD